MKRHHSAGLVLIAAAIAAALLLWPRARSPEAPTLAVGKDVCARCGRLVREAGFGGILRTHDGRTTRYDDLGCLFLSWWAEPRQGTSVIEEAWVEGRADGKLMVARKAHFVRGAQVQTPNSFGVVAFGGLEVAKTYALARGAEVVSLENLREALGELEAHERALSAGSRAESR